MFVEVANFKLTASEAIRMALVFGLLLMKIKTKIRSEAFLNFMETLRFIIMVIKKELQGSADMFKSP